MDERLFDSMVSVRDEQRAATSRTSGSGLYIVRLIAQFHGGTAHAANRADGRGVVVSVGCRSRPRRDGDRATAVRRRSAVARALAPPLAPVNSSGAPPHIGDNGGLRHRPIAHHVPSIAATSRLVACALLLTCSNLFMTFAWYGHLQEPVDAALVDRRAACRG